MMVKLYRLLTLYLCLISVITFLTTPLYSPEQKAQSDAYQQMYEQFFGKAAPQEESVEIPVDLFIDSTCRWNYNFIGYLSNGIKFLKMISLDSSYTTIRKTAKRIPQRN